VEAAELKSGDNVLEVGPGKGVLRQVQKWLQLNTIQV
jgi:16S rRNA A1518/A1519 N6-dimethyltransferase RsmA/KsgA/DIM1 with predicted DNA glycosylase/AP lyase activity